MEVLALVQKIRPVARNTIRTLLERMEEKGWLKHRELGRTFVYSPAVPQGISIGQKIVEVVDEFCGGSVEPLVNALINYRGLSENELKSVRKMLAEAQADNSRKKRSSEKR